MTESKAVDVRRIANITMTDDGCLFVFESITDASRLKAGEIVVRIEASYRDTGSAPRTRDDIVAVWSICIAQTDTRLRVVYECPPFPFWDELSSDLVNRLAAWVAASQYPGTSPSPRRSRPGPSVRADRHRFGPDPPRGRTDHRIPPAPATPAPVNGGTP